VDGSRTRHLSWHLRQLASTGVEEARPKKFDLGHREAERKALSATAKSDRWVTDGELVYASWVSPEMEMRGRHERYPHGIQGLRTGRRIQQFEELVGKTLLHRTKTGREVVQVVLV
jgi:hypothetical protein